MHTGRDMFRTIFLMILYFMAALLTFVVYFIVAFKLLDYIPNETVRYVLFFLCFGGLIWLVRSVSQKVVPKILEKDTDDDYDD